MTQGLIVTVAEGYATGASIYEALRDASIDVAVAVAFDAGNLKPVSEGIRSLYPNARIVVAGDDDHETPGNPGRRYATAAADSVGGSVIFPRFAQPDGRTDFNDLHLEQGIAAVRAQLLEVIEASAERVSLDDVYRAISAESQVLAACAAAAVEGRRTRETSKRREATAWRRLALFRSKLNER